MSQDERWLLKYKEVKSFIEANRRNPSKYDGYRRGLCCNWIHHNKKLLKAGTLKENRIELFKQLLSKIEENKHKNQYQ